MSCPSLPLSLGSLFTEASEPSRKEFARAWVFAGVFSNRPSPKKMYIQAFLKVHKYYVPNQQAFVGGRPFPQRTHRVARAAAMPRFVRSYREKAGSRRRRWAHEESQVDTTDAVGSRHTYSGGVAFVPSLLKYITS